MPEVIQSGDTPQLPGIYFSIENDSSTEPSNTIGVAAVLLTANWGPLGSWASCKTKRAVETRYGTGDGPDVAKLALQGGALEDLVWRVGDPATGTAAKQTLKDMTGTPVSVVDVPLKYKGTRGANFKFTLKDSLDAPATWREFTVYELTKKLQVIRFAKGTGGVGEPQALADAINGSSSDWLGTAVKLAAGNGLMAAVATPTAFTTVAGANPTVDGAAWDAASLAAQGQGWNVLVADTESTTYQATLVEDASLWEAVGLFGLLVLGDPISVTPTASGRYARGVAFNRLNLCYCIDQFRADGAVYEGAQAAGYVAGRLAGYDVQYALDSSPIPGADLPTPISRDEIIDATAAGSITFRTLNKRACITEGVTTYQGDDPNRDDGWKSPLRVMRRYRLLTTLADAWGALRVNNNASGRATVINAGHGAAAPMIAAGYFDSVVITEDAEHPPQGKYAWFDIALVDNDQLTHIIAGVRFWA